MTKTITNLKAVALSRRDTFTIDPKLIEDIPGLNERTDYGDMDPLKNSIREDGVRELIADGEWKHEGVPCKSEPKAASEREQLIIRLIEQVAHNQGKPYTILEEGRVYKRLIAAGVTTKEIQQKTGKSRPAVKNALLLAEADPEVLKQVVAGRISESLVIEFIRENPADPGHVAGRVSETIGNATSVGKTHASRKHAPASSKNGSGGKAHKTNWKNVKGAAGGGNGGKTSFDSTTNLTKLNKLMEELERDKCDPKCWDTIEAVIDFMEGKKTVAEMKNYLRA